MKNDIEIAEELDKELSDLTEDDDGPEDSPKKRGKSLTVLCYLDQKTRIVSDKHSFSLQKWQSTDVEGNELWISHWHYTDIRSLLKNYLQKELRGVRLTNKLKPQIEDLIAEVNKLEKKIESYEVFIKKS